MRMISIGAAALALMSAMAAMAQTNVQTGVGAWQAGDPARAVSIWRPLAESGDADAQFNLAQALRVGKGVTADAAAAIDWYGRAARQGHVQAAANYGLMLFERGDRAAAMPWIKKAADANDARALYVLGTSLFNGDVLPVDRPLAYAYMSRAAASGLAPAQASLAQMDAFMPSDQRTRGLTLASTQTVTPTSAPKIQPKPIAKPIARVAAARPRSGGAWRIQLGAYSSEAAARTAWAALRTRVPALQGSAPHLVRAASMVRLQASDLSNRAAAAALCTKVTAAGGACFPVPPNPS